MPNDDARPVVELRGATVVEAGRPVLDRLDWSLPAGAHAAVLGPNGAGKTTVLRLLAGHRHASAGTVDVLGQRIGRVDVRALRRRIGVVSDAVGHLLDRRAPVRVLVAGALHGLTAPTHRQLDDESLDRADAALAVVDLHGLRDRRCATLSVGEWQRALLARALVLDPALLLLDEPFVGLDLAHRAHLLAHVADVLTGSDAPTGVLVTHHLEELPAAVTHALLLRDGERVAAGPIEEALTSSSVSAAYDLAVDVTVGPDGRRQARPARPV